MADVQGLLADPRFGSLDPASQKQVLGRIDPKFSGLSDSDFSQFMQRVKPTPSPGPEMFDPNRSEPPQEDLLTSIAHFPIHGLEQAVHGVKQLFTPGERLMGAHNAIAGGGKAVAPFALPAALVAAPVATAVGVPVGMAAGSIAPAIARSAGASEGGAQLTGDVVGAVAGGLAGMGITRVPPGATAAATRVVSHVLARKLGIHPAFVDAAIEHLKAQPEILAGQYGGAPYTSELSTYIPGVERPTPGPRGPTVSRPRAPVSGPIPTGTVDIPPQSPVAGVNTNSPVARNAGGPRASGPPPTGTVNVPPVNPTPPPGVNTNSPAARITAQPSTRLANPFTGVVSEGGTMPGEIQTPAATPASPGAPSLDELAQGYGYKSFAAIKDQTARAAVFNAHRAIAAQGAPAAPAPTPAAPAPAEAAPRVNGRPVISQEDGKPLMYSDTAEIPTSEPAKPSPAGFLEAPLSAKDAPDYTQQVMERIAAKASGTPEIGKHQNAYHVGDVSEHKAINVARQLNDEDVTADEYAAMVKKAQASGNWTPIDQINNRAYASGKAGGYRGYLPKNGYSAVSDARRAERGSYQGASTPERIIQHLREYDKLRPKAPPPEAGAPPEPTPQKPSPANELQGPNFDQAPGSGNTATVYTPSEIKMDTRYRVVPLDSLKTSFDEGYPQELQPRNTDRLGSRQRIEKTKSEFNNEKMGESVNAGDGAPIVLPNGAVVTRNHGMQSVRELYNAQSPKAQGYKQWIGENAARFGINPQDVAAIDKPVLVREIQGNRSIPELQKFAEDANMSTTARMSDAEQAQMLSKRMTGDVMEAFNPKDDGTPNPEFVQAIFKGLPAQEQAAFQDAHGHISSGGIRAIRNAVFAKAYPDTSAIERMAESTDDNIRNVTNGMLQAAPKVARLQEEIAKGNRYALGIERDASEAASALDEMKNTGTKVEHWLQQQPMFGRDPVIDEMVKIFTEHKRSPRAIGDVIREYTELVDELGDPKQAGFFGGADPPTKIELLRASNEAVNRRIAIKKAANTTPKLPGYEDAAGSSGPAGGNVQDPR